MTIRHLKVFISVVENGSVTGAAETLHVAQPAVSQTISDLEKYYNVILFDRINNRISLTEDGKRLFLKATETVAAFDEFESAALSALKNPSVSVAASPAAARRLFTKIYDYVGENFPDTLLTLKTESPQGTINAVSRGKYCFAVTEEKPALANVTALPFCGYNLVAVTGGDCELGGATLSAEKFAEQKLCLMKKGNAARDLPEKEFAAKNVFLSPIVETDEQSALIPFLKRGFVSIMTEDFAAPLIREKTLAPVTIEDCDFTVNCYLIKNRDKRFSRTQNAVFEYVKSLGGRA